MWPKHRLFGVDPAALGQELARRDLAIRTRVDQLAQEGERMRAEIDRLQAEVTRLQYLQRDLQATIIAQEYPDIVSLLVTLQHIAHLRSVRTKVADHIQEVLLPYLGERAKEGRPCLRSEA